MKHFTLKTAAASLVAAACIAIPAAGIAAASGTTSDTVPVSVPPKFDLATAKARADVAVQKRLASIGGLQLMLKGVQHPTECQSGNMASQLSADSSGLSALQAQIDALPDGTTAKEFKTYAQQIALNYRIYLLQTPKTHLVVACDRVFVAADALDAAAAKILAKDPTKDVSAIKADAQAARDAAKSAVDRALPLTPDKGNTAVLASNQAALLRSRADIRTAVASLRAGRAAVRALIG